MRDRRNRGDSKKATNDWLTPPEVVKLCGYFDLDPCAFPVMPWRTADHMVSIHAPALAIACTCGSVDPRVHHPQCLSRGCATTGYPVNEVANGLDIGWFGHVWLNMPWDNPLPWVRKMVDHNSGFTLTSAKSTDTRWAQLILKHAQAILFFEGRLLYHYPDGTCSKGGWTPSMLAGFGHMDLVLNALESVRTRYPGVVLVRI